MCNNYLRHTYTVQTKFSFKLSWRNGNFPNLICGKILYILFGIVSSIKFSCMYLELMQRICIKALFWHQILTISLVKILTFIHIESKTSIIISYLTIFFKTTQIFASPPAICLLCAMSTRSWKKKKMLNGVN